MSTWAGRVAWITGAGSDIGRALALELGAAGATVALSGRRADRLEALARELEALGGRALAVPCDVTEERDVEHAVEVVVRELGGLDLAIANAGFSVSGRIAELSAEDWRRQFDTNVVGAAMCARYALPHLERTRGRIGLVGSVSSMLAVPGVGAYSASKYALRALGQTLQMELQGSGVTCTLLHPGFVQSEIAKVDNEGRFDASRDDTRPALLMWTADRAAREMLRALEARRGEHVFTGHGRVGALLGKHAPGLAQRILRVARPKY